MYILTGMKHCGKSTIGALLAKRLGFPFFDLDRAIETTFSLAGTVSVREIYKEQGSGTFQKLETRALRNLVKTGKTPCVLSLGGGTIENREAISILKEVSGFFIFLDVEEHILLTRILRGGIPPFLSASDPAASFHTIFERRVPLYRAAADITVSLGTKNPGTAVETILQTLKEA